MHEFTDYDDALLFYQKEGLARALLTNTPRPGMWAVSMEKPTNRPAQTLREGIAELYAPINDMYDRLEHDDRKEYEKWLLSQAAFSVAHAVAAERGYADQAATFFVDGFTGCSAKHSNPRSAGMEPVFRDGRRAKDNTGVAQLCRASAAALRGQDGHQFEDWLQIKYQVRPVPWRMPFGG